MSRDWERLSEKVPSAADAMVKRPNSFPKKG